MYTTAIAEEHVLYAISTWLSNGIYLYKSYGTWMESRYDHVHLRTQDTWRWNAVSHSGTRSNCAGSGSPYIGS